MKVENIDIDSAIENAQTMIKNDFDISTSVKAMIELLLLIIILLVNTDRALIVKTAANLL